MIFGMTVYNESPFTLSKSLENIRNFYPDDSLFVICDGMPTIAYRDICDFYSVDYHYSDRLKLVVHGAKWWDRFFHTALTYSGNLILKIDPDTRLQRRFESFPDFDFYGSMENDDLIQGGVQAFARSFGETVVRSGVALHSIYCNIDEWATDSRVREYVERTGQMTTDHTIMHIAVRLGARIGNWTEVDSLWFNYRPFRQGVAAIHPVKE